VPHYGRLGNYRFDQSTDDIRGASLYGLHDEKLGKIDDVIFDHSTGDIQYVVVDTGGWLTTKKFILPASRVHASPEHKEDFASDLTKKRIEDFPAYDEKDLDSEKHWGDYENRYRAKWETGPVMHRAETDRNITPTTQQMTGNRSSLRASGSSEPSLANPVAAGRSSAEGESANRVVPAGTDSVVIDSSAAGIGGRWDTFQARLRERRKEAAAGCTTCSIGPESVRGSESADTLKKAI
jgi:hypothetical protein